MSFDDSAVNCRKKQSLPFETKPIVNFCFLFIVALFSVWCRSSFVLTLFSNWFSSNLTVIFAIFTFREEIHLNSTGFLMLSAFKLLFDYNSQDRIKLFNDFLVNFFGFFLKRVRSIRIFNREWPEFFQSRLLLKVVGDCDLKDETSSWKKIKTRANPNTTQTNLQSIFRHFFIYIFILIEVVFWRSYDKFRRSERLGSGRKIFKWRLHISC